MSEPDGPAEVGTGSTGRPEDAETSGAEAGETRRSSASPGAWLRRLLGLTVLVLAATPVFLLLDRPETGRFGQDVLQAASAAWTTSWWGLVVVLGLGLALAILFDGARLHRGLETLGDWAAAVPIAAWAFGAGIVAALLAVLTSRLIFHGLPTLADGMASLVHARYLAAGELAGPHLEPAGAWMIPNTLHTARGWMSQYPPLHPLILAAGLGTGAVWLVGPALTGACVALTCLGAARLLPERPRTVRLAGALLAVSPFLVALGSGYLSHVGAAASIAAAFWAALRARDGHWAWAAVAGAAAGWAVGSRPLTGLVLGAGIPLMVWTGRTAGPEEGRAGWLGARIGAASAAGLPFAMGLLLYDHRFFGSPLRLGYSAAYGPAHGLGFHADPWGNVYGPIEALGFTSADLVTLGAYLLETPLSAVLLVAAFLLLARRLGTGVRVLLAWALMPVAAYALYWHHDVHFGPRMLYESAPAWIVLSAVAAAWIGTAVSASSDGEDPGSRLAERVRTGLLWALVLSFVAAPALGLSRIRSYAWDADTLERIRPPAPPSNGPSLIFAHGTWSERISARLQGDGMRMDSVETALRRNDICRLHRYTEARLRGAPDALAAAPELDFRRLPGTPPDLRLTEVVPGYRIRVGDRSEWTPGCRRQVNADRHGVISLAPLLWQGDLPGIEEGRPLFVRDLGPEANREVRDRYPDRPAFLYRAAGDGAPPTLGPYAEEVRELWNAQPPSSSR